MEPVADALEPLIDGSELVELALDPCLRGGGRGRLLLEAAAVGGDVGRERAATTLVDDSADGAMGGKEDDLG